VLHNSGEELHDSHFAVFIDRSDYTVLSYLEIV